MGLRNRMIDHAERQDESALPTSQPIQQQNGASSRLGPRIRKPTLKTIESGLQRPQSKPLSKNISRDKQKARQATKKAARVLASSLTRQSKSQSSKPSPSDTPPTSYSTSAEPSPLTTEPAPIKAAANTWSKPSSANAKHAHVSNPAEVTISSTLSWLEAIGTQKLHERLEQIDSKRDLTSKATNRQSTLFKSLKSAKKPDKYMKKKNERYELNGKKAE